MNNLEKKKVTAMTVTKWMEDIERLGWTQKTKLLNNFLPDLKLMLSMGSIGKLVDGLHKGQISNSILTEEQCREFLNSGSLFPMLQTIEVASSYGMNLDVISIDEFRKRHKGNLNSSKFDQLLARVYEVELHKSSITFKVEGTRIKEYAAFFNGVTGYFDSKDRFVQYDIDGYRHKLPVIAGGKQNKIITERLIRGLLDVYTGVMLENYKGVQCNVLNLSGSLATCQKYGIKMDFSPWNIEWCSAENNRDHSKMMHTINKKFNNKLIDNNNIEWRIGLSALDPVSHIYSTNRDYEKLIDDVMDLKIVQSNKTRRV